MRKMNREGAYRNADFRSGVGFYSSQICRRFRTLRPSLLSRVLLNQGSKIYRAVIVVST